MLAGYFSSLTEPGRKIAYTFVPGNLTELLTSFDLLPVYPEINALQSGMRQRSGDFVREAEARLIEECDYRLEAERHAHGHLLGVHRIEAAQDAHSHSLVHDR